VGRRRRAEIRVNLRALHRPGAIVALRFVPTGAAGLLLAVTAATTQLAPLARGGAIGVLVVSVLMAVIPRRENVKAHGAFIFAIIAVAITGLTRTGLPYEIGSALFLLLSLACLRAPVVVLRMKAADAASGTSFDDPSGRVTPARATLHPRTILVLFVVAAVVAGGFIRLLPPAGAYVERQVQRYAGDAVLRDDDRIGFATNIRVGSLSHLLASDRVVMRIGGEAPELLRGVVLDSYDRRIWSSTGSKTTTTVLTSSPLERATTRIELSRSALSGPVAEPRWFLPDDACDVHTPSGRMGVDPHGTAHPDPPGDAREVSFRRASSGSCSARLPVPAPPTAVDLDLAAKIRLELAPIAYEWTRGATTKQAALDAIATRLAAFDYSLEERRESRVDPIVEFLTVHRSGHCELFASSMALLARSAGIPARVVVGYRVDEVNPITGLAVVRDRNAHSWVEAWVGDRWVTFDPTPLAEMHRTTRPSAWEHFAEALSLAWDRSLGFLAHLTLLGTGLMFAIAAAVLIVVRHFTQRGKRGLGDSDAASRPLPAYETLASALENAGFVRTASEPLERFARRVHGGGEAWSADVADGLERYAALRYGGIGEERRIAESLDALARRVGPAS
jgi:protein-glutamine gamma-glutamyltransferase